jgi:hypothetical protein
MHETLQRPPSVADETVQSQPEGVGASPATTGPGGGTPAERSPVDRGQPSAESPVRSALSVLTTLGPPLSIITALLFYFGWARSDQQAFYMGLDVSLMGYSTQDYVLRSISSLYIPLLVILSLGLGWLAMHHRIVRMLGNGTSLFRLQFYGRVAMYVGLVGAAGAIVTVFVDRELAPLIIPLALAGGVVTAAYGAWVANEAHRRIDDSEPALPSWQRALRTFLLGSVVTLALFWELSVYAGVVGRGYALDLARDISTLPRATVFSAAPLGVEAPGIDEQRIGNQPGTEDESARYRTTGLRLLARSGGKIFLLHDEWTPQRGTVIVLPDSDLMHWQFSH